MEQYVVSVVVPTCGRPDLLNRCIEALCRQTLDPRTYEIIIVDDRSSVQTRQIVEGWGGRVSGSGPAVIYLANHGPHGPAAARNRGWRHAKASVIAFTDDDTVPTPDWLENALQAFEPDAGALCGAIVMPVPDQPTDYERDSKHLETAEFVTANCLLRRSVLEPLKGFDERFQMAWREDSDLHFRLLELNQRIVHAPRAVVVHPVRPARWGVSLSQQKKILFDALLYKKHPRLYRERIRAHPRWDYYVIVAALLSMPAFLALGQAAAALAAFLVWAGMTARFCWKRLAGTRKSVSHVLEMIYTSILIPPCAVYWRLVGALRFKVGFI